MNNQQITNFDQLPLIMNAQTLASTLGISQAGAYNLMHQKDFPTLHVGTRMLVSRDNFINWMQQHVSNADF